MSLSGLFRDPPPDSEEEVDEDADAKRAAALVVRTQQRDEGGTQDTLVFASACVGLTDSTDRLKLRGVWYC